MGFLEHPSLPPWHQERAAVSAELDFSLTMDVPLTETCAGPEILISLAQ